MKKLTVVLALTAMTVIVTGTVHGQFEPGVISFRPEVGFGWESTVGVSFGGAVTYGLSDNVAVGPVFMYSMAGRKWEGEQGGQSFKTKGSNTMTVAGRIYYFFEEGFNYPGFDYPWYIDAGVGIVKFGSIEEFDDGTKISIQNEEGEIKGAIRFAFNIGTGSVFEMSDNMAILLDVNSYIGGYGDRKGKNRSQDDIDLNNDLEGGTFWLLNFALGLNLTF